MIRPLESSSETSSVQSPVTKNFGRIPCCSTQHLMRVFVVRVGMAHEYPVCLPPVYGTTATFRMPPRRRLAPPFDAASGEVNQSHRPNQLRGSCRTSPSAPAPHVAHGINGGSASDDATHEQSLGPAAARSASVAPCIHVRDCASPNRRNGTLEIAGGADQKRVPAAETCT